MINNSLKTIILAAGESKRILSSKPKILHTIGGKTILGHVLYNMGKIISKKNINIVISPKLNQLRNEYKKINFSFQNFLNIKNRIKLYCNSIAINCKNIRGYLGFGVPGEIRTHDPIS